MTPQLALVTTGRYCVTVRIFDIEIEFEFTVFVVEPRVRTALPSSAIDSTSN